jgi:hypothetical protein
MKMTGNNTYNANDNNAAADINAMMQTTNDDADNAAAMQVTGDDAEKNRTPATQPTRAQTMTAQMMTPQTTTP